MTTELMQDAPATPAPAEPLETTIARVLFEARNNAEYDFDRAASDAAGEGEAQLLEICDQEAGAITLVLQSLGHVLPGAPPAQQILEDAKSFAARLTLSNLALRILNMLAWSNVQTPESKPARRWLEDYLEGRNHGPVGHPMLWPGKLPGLASLLRQWGFVPTIAAPGQASYVARAMPNPTPQ